MLDLEDFLRSVLRSIRMLRWWARFDFAIIGIRLNTKGYIEYVSIVGAMGIFQEIVKLWSRKLQPSLEWLLATNLPNQTAEVYPNNQCQQQP